MSIILKVGGARTIMGSIILKKRFPQKYDSLCLCTLQWLTVWFFLVLLFLPVHGQKRWNNQIERNGEQSWKLDNSWQCKISTKIINLKPRTLENDTHMIHLKLTGLEHNTQIIHLDTFGMDEVGQWQNNGLKQYQKMIARHETNERRGVSSTSYSYETEKAQ